MLSGSIFITDNLDIIYNANFTTKIINLDEDNILESSNNNIINGTCLLPPMEAKIAEADGNEEMYDIIYSGHLLLPNQQEFISALIAFLYKGGNLILFLPELGYNNTRDKLIEHLFKAYGIRPGIIGSDNPVCANCFYDAKCIPMWLNLVLISGVISYEEYLYRYPLDAVISDGAMNILLKEINPYAETINEQVEYIKSLHKKSHDNPGITPAIQRR